MDEDQRKLLTVAATAGAIGLFAGVVRGVVQQRHGGWPNFFRGLAASVAVAILVGWGLDDAGLSPTKAAAIIGVCSWLADDVLLGLGELAKVFGADPLGFIDRVWKAIRGQKQ